MFIKIALLIFLEPDLIAKLAQINTNTNKSIDTNKYNHLVTSYYNSAANGSRYAN